MVELSGFNGLLLSNIAAIFVAVVMARAAVHKLQDPSFEGTLADYQLLPERLVPRAVPLLAGAEVVAALGLCVLATRPFAAALAAALLVIYAGAMAINLLRGRREIDCGCGGPGDVISWALVARNAALLVILLPALIGVPADSIDMALGVAGILVTAVSVALLFLALVLFESVATRSAAIALRLPARR